MAKYTYFVSYALELYDNYDLHNKYSQTYVRFTSGRVTHHTKLEDLTFEQLKDIEKDYESKHDSLKRATILDWKRCG